MSDVIVDTALITKFKFKRNWKNFIVNWEWNGGLLPYFMNHYICFSSIHKIRVTNSYGFLALSFFSGSLGLDTEVLLYIQLSFTVLLCNRTIIITYYPKSDVVVQWTYYLTSLLQWYLYSDDKGALWQHKLVTCHISVLQMLKQNHCIWECVEFSSPVLPCTLYHTIITKWFEDLSYPIVYDFSSLLELLFPNLSYDYACG